MDMGRKFWFSIAALICATGLVALKVIDADVWMKVIYMVVPAFVGGNAVEHIAGAAKAKKIGGTQ